MKNLSKEFSPDPLCKRIPQRSIREINWMSIPSKDSSPSYHRVIKDIEAKLLKEAKEKAMYIEREAYEKGFSQGEKNGFELGNQRVEILIQHFKNLLEEMIQKREELFESFKKDLVKVVLVVTKRIIHRELSLSPEIIEETLQRAFRYIVNSQQIIIHLNPLDYKYISSHPSVLSFIGKSLNEIKLIEDQNITRGGCYLETSFGDVDATIESQFSKIESFIWENIKTVNHEFPISKGTP